MSGTSKSTDGEFTFAPFSYADVCALTRGLEVPEPVAVALARRGYDTVDAARAFLAADEVHDPSEFDGIEDAMAAIRSAISAGNRITVHGDYDVDGVTATTILVSALRGLGADCDWLIPGRVDDGYGLSLSTVDRLAERGTRLLITVDCGITSVAEVAAARSRGIEAIVTDHHQPGDELPDCPIVHPVVSGYPCPDLCAAGVAYKLAAALTSTTDADRDLDLVALATVADMVPLTGENRSLVRRGLEQARRAARPGMRALMAVAAVAPERLQADDLSFRLAPRINAAGRLYRADAGVELFLASDDDRARRIAEELDRANQERRQTEADVLADAQRRLRDLGPDGAEAPALVLWGEGWHPGVVGICASRLAERHGKPAVLVAVSDGRGKGSGRSIPGFDLLAGLRACASQLARFGGHRAAAGLEIEASRLPAFREAFMEHTAAALAQSPPATGEPIDAVVGCEELSHELAGQLARLGPFGKGNPEPRILVPCTRITDLRPMGEGDRHARLTLTSGDARISGVAFGVGSSLDDPAAAAAVDVSVRLELNEWNGAVAPRVVLGDVREPEPVPVTPSAICRDDEYSARLSAELAAKPGLPDLRLEPRGMRARLDRSGASAIASVAALATSGMPVLVIGADALWRRALLDSAANPKRFGGGEAAILAGRGSLEAGRQQIDGLLAAGRGGVALADWAALELAADVVSAFPHVLLADPAPRPAVEALALAADVRGEGFVHVLSSHRDPSLSVRALELALPDRAALGELYRALRREAPDRPLDLRAARAVLEAASPVRRSPEWCGRALRVLAEVGVVRVTGAGRETMLEVVSSVRGELERSPSYAANRMAHEECVRFLTRGKEQSSSPMPAAA